MSSWRGWALFGLIAVVLSAGLALGAVAQVAQPVSPERRAASGDASDAKAPGSADATVSAPRPLHPPIDPTSAAVYAVLEKHCARCHQGGRLGIPAPAAALGNILRLDEIAATPSLVQPRNPDASRLYTMMLRRLMPPTENAEGASPALPTSDEIAHVRSWIADLPPRQSCGDRASVTTADHAATLSQLATTTGENPKRLRFLSIAHLYNGCVRREALAAYRQAIVRLFNSLSWKAAPVAVPPVDPTGTLFKINLDDLGWLPEHWERIMRSGSSPLGLTAPLPLDSRRAYGTDIPIARADWFAKTVLSAPLYYEVLGLPGTGPEIRKILHVATPSGGNGATGPRDVIQAPSFSLQPSLVERHQSRSGPVWEAYHWLSGEEVPAFDPDNLPPLADLSPPHHATRGIFTLPNGLPGFFVTGQRGDRLDALPPGIAMPSVSGRAPISGGLDCMACHSRGPIAWSAADARPASPLATAPGADGKAISDAMRRVGIDPDLALDGVAPVIALAQEYARPLDGTRAAAELGVGLTALADLADRDGGAQPASVLARRLFQGLVARSEVEARAKELTAALGRPHLDIVDKSGVPTRTGERSFAPIDRGPSLVLYSDKARYRRGDSLRITVRAVSDCHLTVVSIDTRGRGTVLFPNDFEASSLVTAGQVLELPGPGAPYTLRLNEAGRETIVALCNATGALTDNIRYDFEHQRFTELGNYATFLSQNALVDPGKAENEPSPSPSRRGRRVAAEAASETHARPDQVFRTAISIVVE